VTAQRTRSKEIRIIDVVEHRLLEIRITNSSDADVFELSSLLHSRKRGVYLGDGLTDIDDVSRSSMGGRLWRNWGSMDVEGRCGNPAVDTGVSTLRVYLNRDQRRSRIAVGFLDRNGREWTRWLDGELVEARRLPL
jgi:hypothetical protein